MAKKPKNKILEKQSIKIYKIDPFFYEHDKEKIKVDENGCEDILFRIDVYFTEYFSAVEIDEQNHKGRDLISEKQKTKKNKRHQKKNLVASLLELIQVMQKDAMIQTYDTDYEVSKIQIFISNFKEKKTK